MTRVHIFLTLIVSVFFLSTKNISAISVNVFRWPWSKHKPKPEDDKFSVNDREEIIPDDEDTMDADDDDEEILAGQHQLGRTPFIRRENSHDWQNDLHHSNLMAPTPFPGYSAYHSLNDFNLEQNQGDNGLLRGRISLNVPQSMTPPAPQPVYIPYPIPSPSAPSCGSCGSPVTVVSVPSNGGSQLASSKCRCCCDTSEKEQGSTSNYDKTAEDIETIQKSQSEDDEPDQKRQSKNHSKKSKNEDDDENELTENEGISDLSADDENVDASD